MTRVCRSANSRANRSANGTWTSGGDGQQTSRVGRGSGMGGTRLGGTCGGKDLHLWFKDDDDDDDE
jgi:hypothetical protein